MADGDIVIVNKEHLELIQEVNALRSTLKIKEEQYKASLIIIGYLERRLKKMMEKKYE